MAYEVFARKYRPQTFDDLVGQNHLVQTLKNAVVQNRLAHAYLFVGPRGTGKTSTARILAKALNCVKGPTVTPCGECDPCREISAGNSFGVFEYDAASNTQVDKIRELIIERAKIAAPPGYKYKIYIIDEVHMLSNSSFNALLKTLEEPPPHVIFIFATTEVQKVPLTIISRCQRFDLHRIPAKLIADHLQFIAGKEKITLEPAAAHAIARGAEGGLRDAESMLDQLVAFCGNTIAEPDVLNVFGFTSEQTVTDFTDRIVRGATAEAIGLLHEQSEIGKDMMKLTSDLIAYLRDLLVYKVKPEALAEDTSPELQKSLESQAAIIEMDRLLELIDQFAAAEARMKWAPNKKLHLEVAVIKAIQTLSQVTLNEVIENLSALRDGSAKGGEGKPAIARPPVSTATPSLARSKPGRPSPAEKPLQSNTAKVAEDPNDQLPIDFKAAWQGVVAAARARRPLIRTWIEQAKALGVEGRFFLLGFPPEQKSVMESLARPANREFLEALLKEQTGRELSLKLSVKEGLVASPSPVEDEIAPTPPAKKTAPRAEFKDDPLIREALEIFKGEIKPVTD